MFDKHNNYEPHCNKSEKRLHTSRAALFCISQVNFFTAQFWFDQ